MNDPSPIVIVYPTDELAQQASENRIQVMIDKCPELRELYLLRKSKQQEKRFKGMTLYLRSAHTPAKLASIAAKRLLMDETDKFPTSTKKEASPFKLAEERTKTYQFTKKIFDNCTPTYTNGHIWQEKETADVERHYFVPCPHCGTEIELIFKNIRWAQEKELTNAEKAENAMYYCQACGSGIDDASKPFMLRQGKWKEVARRIGQKQHPKKVAFWINTLYSPFVSWADIAKQFIDSEKDLEQLQNFVNSWLAEPWNHTTVKLNRDKILEKAGGYTEGVVPDDTLIITGGVDVQKDCFYYTIRAWGEGITSWNIRHGMVETWTEIEDVMNHPYITESGKTFFVNLCAVDSGYNADEVYDFCTANSEWAIPIKGSNREIKQKYSFTAIDRDEQGRPAIILYTLDVDFYKNFVSNRISKEQGEPGCWYVYDGCDAEYAEQICSEEKIVEKKGGQIIETWRPKTAHPNNHYWDCEVYAAFAADKLDIRYIRKVERQPSKEVSVEKKTEEDWLNTGGFWLENI